MTNSYDLPFCKVPGCVLKVSHNGLTFCHQHLASQTDLEEKVDHKKEQMRKYCEGLNFFRDGRLELIEESPFDALCNMNTLIDAAEHEFKKTLTTLLKTNTSSEEIIKLLTDKLLWMTQEINNSTSAARNLMYQYLVQEYSNFIRRSERGF